MSREQKSPSRREVLAAIGAAMLVGDARGQEAEAVRTATGSQFELKELEATLARRGGVWHEFLKNGSMRLGLYQLRAGAEDGQHPHDEDEAYYVIRGRSKFRMGETVSDVGPGTVLFVPARLTHRFEAITEDLLLLVFFSRARPDPGPDEGG